MNASDIEIEQTLKQHFNTIYQNRTNIVEKYICICNEKYVFEINKKYPYL